MRRIDFETADKLRISVWVDDSPGTVATFVIEGFGQRLQLYNVEHVRALHSALTRILEGR